CDRQRRRPRISAPVCGRPRDRSPARGAAPRRDVREPLPASKAFSLKRLRYLASRASKGFIARRGPRVRWLRSCSPMSHQGQVTDVANVVAAHDVTRRYGEDATAVDALRGVSLDVRPGEVVAVMGPSGSGKSTLMHTLAGLDKPSSGSVEIGGEEITGMDDAKLTQLRRDHVGFVFQFFNLLPMLSAEDNIVLPLTIAGEYVDRAWLEELLSRTGLYGRRAHRPAEL